MEKIFLKIITDSKTNSIFHWKLTNKIETENTNLEDFNKWIKNNPGPYYINIINTI